MRMFTELKFVFANLTLCDFTMATLICGCVWTIAEIPLVIKEMFLESICNGKYPFPELSLKRGKWWPPGALTISSIRLRLLITRLHMSTVSKLGT